MGFRRVVGFSLFIIFLCFTNLASSYHIRNTLPSEFVQKSMNEDKATYGSKIEGGGNHGGGHGGQSHGNGGESGSSNRPGGAGAIPVYVAGAANKNRQHQSHRGAANCNLNNIKISTMIMMTLVYPLVQLFLLV